ncbi:rod shape-determining protein [Kribbella sp.]|uniref:rod shape-determining protein n=1 Tax=Kribbella sp. TaxID=1871183 RepID=UPI002D3B3EE0|nr:rod shape-determining protein [Kribbella sp.]HZX04163.1 rod shape-determining protein [Kribbella sp.]
MKRGLVGFGGVRGVALDLGSARARVWSSERGLVLDAPTARRGRRLVSRGTVADVAGVVALVGAAVEDGRRDRLSAVVTTPVLSDDSHRADVRTVLAELGVGSVVMIDSVKAAAFGAGADVAGPLLVVDLGAQLTEVALVVGGAVVAARRTALGLDDVRTVFPIVEVVGEAVLELLHGDCGAQVVDALDRGVLLTGGGALRPELTYKLGHRLGAPVAPAPAPHTAAVRGAATALQATHRHPTGS